MATPPKATRLQEWQAREKEGLIRNTNEELLDLLFNSGKEVGEHAQEEPMERSWSVDGAYVKAAAIKEILLERLEGGQTTTIIPPIETHFRKVKFVQE